MQMATRGSFHKLNNPETLIRFAQTVEKYPQIYNPNHGGTKEDIENAWLEIAQLFDETAVNCATKWHTLRSNFNRSLRLKTKNAKTYYLAKHLQFLLPFLKARSDNELSKVSWENSSLNNSDCENEFLNCSSMDSCQAIENIPSIITTDLVTVKQESADEESVQSEPITPLYKYTAHNEAPAQALKRKRSSEELRAEIKEDRSKQNDSDFEFFRSLMPLLEKLNDSQTLAFRIRVLQNLQEIIDGKR